MMEWSFEGMMTDEERNMKIVRQGKGRPGLTSLSQIQSRSQSDWLQPLDPDG